LFVYSNISIINYSPIAFRNQFADTYISLNLLLVFN